MTKHVLFLLSACGVFVANAAPLDIADVPLELSPASSPNVLFLTDDSGSMDWEVLTQDVSNSGAFSGPSLDGSGGAANIVHRVPIGGNPATCQKYIDPATAIAGPGDFVNGYLYGVRFLNTNQLVPSDADLLIDPFIKNCFVADDSSFRFRNATFNPQYFDPNKTYVPWAGLDNQGMPYDNIDITNAPDDPYDPLGTERINLTIHEAGLDLGGNRIIGAGFKYYDWNDDGDGLFEAGEEVENLISAQDAATQQNFANWFGYYRKREYVAKAIASQAVGESSTARIGFATTNQNASQNSANVLEFNSTQRSSVLREISRVNSTGNSELRVSLDKVGKYFSCVSGDIFNSSSDSNPGDANCPVLAAPAGECQSNAAFFITDGFGNGINDPVPSVGDADSDNSSNNANGITLDGGAFADSSLSTNTLGNTIADVAMHYYESDLHAGPILLDLVPVTSIDFNRDPNGALQAGDTLHQHMNTNVVGIFNTVNLNPSVFSSFPSATSSPSWLDSVNFDGKIDELRHAAYNGRGKFIPTFAGKDFSSVVNDVENAFARATSNSGSTTAMAFNTQSITQNSLVFRTFSNLATNSGNLVAQQVNADGSFDVDIATGDPVFVWDAATVLDTQPSRTILTYNPATQQGIPFLFSNLTTGLGGQREAIQNTPTPIPTSPANPIVQTRVEYLLGDTTKEGTSFDNGDMRIRAPLDTVNGITTGGLIGDIVHSSPMFVGEPPFANRNSGLFPSGTGNTYFEFRATNQSRQELVYVGANDGMLHAFQASDGVEKFAYIPDVLLDEIGNYTSPDYQHQFYVDSTPSINDAYIVPKGGTSPEWRTVLVNGLGAGGKGYFALDITDPNAIGNNSVLWEFTEEDDGVTGASDLGLTYSQPIIAMSNDTVSGEQRWVAIFGNGFNSTDSQEAAIYILFLDAGYDGWTSGDFIKIKTGVGADSNGTPNGIGGVTGIDRDGNGTIDRLYAGDLQGNVYVFDISDSSSPTNWVLEKTLFKAEYTPGFPVNADPQPITTKPTVVANPSALGGYIVMVGTGSYITTQDATSTEIQSIYGLLDNPSGNTATITKYSSPSQLVEQTFTTAVDNSSGLVVRTITDNPVVLNDTGSNQVRGWFIDFDVPPPGVGATGIQFPGERAVRNLQLRNDQLFFSTVIPQVGASCAPPAGGFGLSVNALTGGVAVDVIFDINIDGLFNADDNLNGVIGNIIVGTRFESAPSDSTFIGDYRVTQLSNSDVDRILVNPDLNNGGSVGALLGRHSWKEISQ
ncbi:MAG: pilus assembly protein [Gammaproteobacteria bacterium]